MLESDVEAWKKQWRDGGSFQKKGGGESFVWGSVTILPATSRAIHRAPPDSRSNACVITNSPTQKVTPELSVRVS